VRYPTNGGAAWGWLPLWLMRAWSLYLWRRCTHSRSQAHFQSMEVRTDQFTAFIDVLTTNTYIMVIVSDPTIRKSATHGTTSHRTK